MSVRRLHSEQPESFEFSSENLDWAKHVITRYPQGRQASAVIPLLMRAQEQEGWVTQPAIEYVADMLDMPYIRVLEVATFYTQFQLQPVGKKAHIQVCGTTPCMLRGAEDLIRVCKNKIAQKPLSLSEDGNFSWEEVECAGTCVNAPMIQIFKDTYEDLTPEILEELIAKIDAGEEIIPGTQQKDRINGAAAQGQTTLTDPSLYDGSMVKYGLGAGIDEPKVAPVGAVLDAEIAPETKAKTKTKTKSVAKEVAAEAKPAPAIKPDQLKVGEPAPALLAEPIDGKADNLKEISGIGPVIERKLNAMGVYHFSQIASWDAENCAYVDGQLAFKGRIGRENWVEQAKAKASETFDTKSGEDK
ncbi:NADH-quinone oxidoreductase subunit NuoE [Cohaesibacter celericrescens]|uniref:NADH-quinone oxidoreductase subunit NuoE n=1 Tax=Cohaesibacter celericrescens TaxID=2067669 RepID=A0A2N5XSS8_9HYPH|nr:NADH-quinone oxidoreductase subunit NuoE [Cohaesibacter celericrescens]PLW77468.1 NADH-quinone oxidoreductase subunit NuoE [Cohaesibacter celericrescens]